MTLYEMENYALNWMASIGLHIGVPVISGVFAIVGAADATGIGSLLGALGPSGVMAWYLWYNVKHVLPKKDDQITKLAEKHEESERSNREHYEMVLAKQHEFHREQREEDRRVLSRVADSSDRVASTLDKMSSTCEIKVK